MPIFESRTVKSLQEVNTEPVLNAPMIRTYNDGYLLVLWLISFALLTASLNFVSASGAPTLNLNCL